MKRRSPSKGTFIALALCWMVAGLFSARSYGGTFGMTSAGQPRRWKPNTPIPYVVNPGGVPGFTGELERLVALGAVADAFRAWTEIPEAAISFTTTGTSALTTGAPDGLNLISFQDTSFSFPPGVLAVARTASAPAAGPVLVGGQVVVAEFAGQILDADILFNPNLTSTPFSPVGADNSVDIIAVGIHEIGHLLGLDHTGVYSSIMNPYSESSAGVSHRAVEFDDRITVAAQYPASGIASSRGTLTGTITSSTGSPVKSAHVVAVSEPGGIPIASQLSGPDGSYRISGLPPGNYRVLGEPLDGPIGLSDFGSFFSDGDSSFATTFLGGISSPTTVAVTAGQTNTANVVLPAPPATLLNIELTGVVVGTSVRLGGNPLYLPRGGSFLIAATEITRASDTVFSFSAPDVTRVGSALRGTLSDGTPISAQNITIGATGALGPSNLAVSNANGTTVMAGGVVVTVNPQAATPLRDGAGFGTTLAPGAFVSIFGGDLAGGGRSAAATPLPTNLSGISVKIGDRFAPLFFAGPGQINALIPFEVAGTSTTLTVVTGPLAAGNTVQMNLSPTAPGIFATNQAGTGQGAILNVDASFVGPVGSIPGTNAHPARRNDVIVIFASGLGRVTPALPSGVAAGASGTTIPRLVNPPQVRIGGQLATVEFAGLAPSFVGLYQVNVRIPNSAPLGDNVQVQITTFEGQTSNTVTIAISP